MTKPSDKKYCGICEIKLEPPEPYRVGMGRKKQLVCSGCFSK